MEGSRELRVAAPPARRPWYSILYVQVLVAIALGVVVGYFDPKLGVQLKPLGDAPGDYVRVKS